MSPAHLYYNPQFIDNPNRVKTPPLLQQSEISDLAPVETTFDFVNTRPRKKILATPKLKSGFSTPLGQQFHTVPRGGKTNNDFIINICTPQSTPTDKPRPKDTPHIPEPLHRPGRGYQGTQPIQKPTSAGVGGPSESQGIQSHSLNQGTKTLLDQLLSLEIPLILSEFSESHLKFQGLQTFLGQHLT